MVVVPDFGELIGLSRMQFDKTRNLASLPAAAYLFLLGFGLFTFTRRSELVPTIPATIVVAPIFILRFSRSQPIRRAWVLTFLGFLLSMNVALWGLFGLTDDILAVVMNVLRSTLLALMYALPYFIDRAVTPRLGNRFWVTLVFPVTTTAILFLASLEGPFDGAAAKSIYATGPLSLRQLYSLTGLWGFVFLWSWLAALANYVWDRRFSGKPTLLAALAFTVLIGGILIYGTVRLSNSRNFGTARIAAVVLLPEDGKAISMDVVNQEKRPVPYDETLNRIEMLTAEAASAGAEIVAFQETAMTVLEEDIDRVRADYARIATENELWLSITYAWYADEGKGANMHLLIDDRGQIQADYQKRFLLGFGQFGETAVFSKGVEKIQVADSPYGRIAVSICRDMNFPAYARQAAKSSTDIMLTPAYDFPKCTAPFDYARAIECGFSLVRPTYNGVSYAVDPYGRILTQVDSDEGGSGITYAEVPTQGVQTMYARFGDLFAWLNVLSLSVFAVYSFSQKGPAIAAAVEHGERR